jgi:hypothetical protein
LYLIIVFNAFGVLYLDEITAAVASQLFIRNKGKPEEQGQTRHEENKGEPALRQYGGATSEASRTHGGKKRLEHGRKSIKINFLITHPPSFHSHLHDYWYVSASVHSK